MTLVGEIVTQPAHTGLESFVTQPAQARLGFCLPQPAQARLGRCLPQPAQARLRSLCLTQPAQARLGCWPNLRKLGWDARQSALSGERNSSWSISVVKLMKLAPSRRRGLANCA